MAIILPVWKGHLAGELPPPRKVKRVAHWPALPWQEMGALMAALAEREGAAAQALRFAVLTAASSSEVRGMRWREVDFDENVWNIPAARMKAFRRHRIPMPPAALAVLAEVRPLAKGPNDLISVPRRAKWQAAVRHGPVGGGTAHERRR
jgi:integrase